MSLIDEILEPKNMLSAMMHVYEQKGAAGIDGMSVDELKARFPAEMGRIAQEIREKSYKPSPVRRVYIPKPDGKKRPLGIPTVYDRAVQQAAAQKLSDIYEPVFSEYSYGFRPERGCHDAVAQAVAYMNEGYEWVIDLDISKFFDTVCHDKLISILREQVSDPAVLHLVRAYLKAGVMEDGLVSATDMGVPQGGPLSVVLSNIYLDKLDKELESRGLRFARYADDCDIFVKSERSADRVMKSITGWIERKLFLKVNAEKSKVVRPPKSTFLGFTFWKSKDGWKCRPADDRKQRLRDKVKKILLRKEAIARKLGDTVRLLNWTVGGWINYYSIGNMKKFLEEFGMWMRHKVRVVIMKQWKKPRTIYRNLKRLNAFLKASFTDVQIYSVANSRLGWYSRSGMITANVLISRKIMEQRNPAEQRPALLDPVRIYNRQRAKLYEKYASVM